MRIAVVLLLALLPACHWLPNDEPVAEAQYLFEVQYLNHAWGYQLSGFYIDDRGRVYRYDHSDAVWQPARWDVFTPAELAQKFSRNRTGDGQVDAVTLRAMHALIDPASRGPLSDPVARCADAGTHTYLAYQFEAGVYRPVLLYQAGDLAQLNRSESARVLFAWLRTIDGAERDLICARTTQAARRPTLVMLP
jgi:hypothetical protein